VFLAGDSAWVGGGVRERPYMPHVREEFKSPTSPLPCLFASGSQVQTAPIRGEISSFVLW
jgi:hypothetical protein